MKKLVFRWGLGAFALTLIFGVVLAATANAAPQQSAKDTPVPAVEIQQASVSASDQTTPADLRDLEEKLETCEYGYAYQSTVTVGRVIRYVSASVSTFFGTTYWDFSRTVSRNSFAEPGQPESSTYSDSFCFDDYDDGGDVIVLPDGG